MIFWLRVSHINYTWRIINSVYSKLFYIQRVFHSCIFLRYSNIHEQVWPLCRAPFTAKAIRLEHKVPRRAKHSNLLLKIVIYNKPFYNIGSCCYFAQCCSTESCSAEGHSAKYHSIEYHSAECHYVEYHSANC